MLGSHILTLTTTLGWEFDGDGFLVLKHAMLGYVGVHWGPHFD